MKTLVLIYNPSGLYTVKLDNWSLTGPLSMISKVMDNCFEEGIFIEWVKNYIGNE